MEFLLWAFKTPFNLLNNAPTASTVKIFFFIALNQPEEGIRGYETTKIQLAVDLNLKKSIIFRDLHWLEENILINEIKQVETVDFMANPYYVMNNSDPQARKDEWKRRCRLDIQREIRLKKERRIREWRKASKQ